jgi:hypothetical protein
MMALFTMSWELDGGKREQEGLARGRCQDDYRHIMMQFHNNENYMRTKGKVN